MHDSGLRRCGNDDATATTTSPVTSRDAQPSATALAGLLRRFLAQAHDGAAATLSLDSGTLTHGASEPTPEKTSPTATGEQRVVRQRVKVAVVGESESGRTSLCASLGAAAEGTTAHPLVVSGAEASLSLDASVLSVQTYDLATKRDRVALEVTITDSGPAPLTSGAGSWAVAEADVVLLCFPLYGIKQVVGTRRAADGVDSPDVSRGLFGGAAPKPTEAFIRAGECQLLCTLLGLVSSRCCRVARANPFAAPPAVLLVGTFQDTLRDASVAAAHTILSSLLRLCSRAAQQQSSVLLRVHDAVAVSTTQGTCVSLHSTQQSSLAAWWPRMLDSVVVAAAAAQNRAGPPCASNDALRHLLGHHNSLTALHEGLRHVCDGGRSSPRLFRVTGPVYAPAVVVASVEVATREMRAEDARAASLVIDFVTQLKARKRIWLFPLPRLWRVAYALGMQAREQLYLVVRQMEAAGEVLLLGRTLAYAHDGDASGFAGTNETVCLRPALLRASLAVVYVYSDWAARRQRRHVRKCLRSVDVDECDTADTSGLAAKGQFSTALLYRLAPALALKSTSAAEAAEVLAATLMGADLAYVSVRAELAACCKDGGGGVDAAADTTTTTASASLRAQKPLLPPPRVVSTPVASGVTRPVRGSAHVASTATVDELLDLSTSSPPLDDVDGRSNTGATRRATVEQLTSLFLLGDITPTPDASSAAPSRSTSTYYDPLRDALHSPHHGARSEDRTSTGTLRGVVLVVPVLQSRAPCPAPLLRQVALQASRAATSVAAGVASTQLGLRLDPFPADLVASLMCRFASVGMRVERAYHDAVIFSGDANHLLRRTRAHVRASADASAATAPLAAAAASGCPHSVERSVCLFLHCTPPSDDTPACTAALLRLCVFADSTTQAHFVEQAVCRELSRFLLQRAPGVATSPVAAAEAETVLEAPPTVARPEYRNVAELLCRLMQDDT